MKFSFRQILASAVGAVLAAIVASVFGVKGTVVGMQWALRMHGFDENAPAEIPPV